MSGTEPLSYNVGRARIVVDYVDIVSLPVDAIVSSDDVGLTMGGGVSEAIKKAGGQQVFDEARRPAALALGNVVVTSAGALPQKFVFHAAVLDYALSDRGVSADVVRAAVRACFDECPNRHIRSIGFPALASGTGKLSPEQSASAILVETLAYLEKQPELETVYIVINPEGDSDIQKRFYDQIKQYLGLREAAKRVDTAAFHYQQFSPAPSSNELAETTNLAAVRDQLNAGMVSAPTREFTSTVGSEVSDRLGDEIEKLRGSFEAQIERTTGPLSTRFRAEMLRLQRDKAFVERQRLEWEATAQRTLTPEREKEISFLASQEKKFEAELLDLENRTRPLVISIHGILTRGAWQKEITPALNYAGFNHVPLDYGHFPLRRFLRRTKRQEQVDAFREAYKLHGARTATGYPSLIAHSLGSYIVTEAMAKYNLKFDQMILCGAIVKPDYDWDTAHTEQFMKRVLNDHGRLDIWSRVAAFALSDAGQSGLKGFTKTAGGQVLNRDHARFGHSDYFYAKNYVDNWIPFLKGEKPAELVNLGSTRRNFRFLMVIAFALAAALALFMFL